MPLPSLADVKTYLGLTGTQDDALITSLLPFGVARAEHDTSRTFSSSSNVTTRYSTDGQATLVIHDRPYVDASRTVQWLGVTMTEGTNVWFLPDRRDQNITTTIQMRYFDVGTANWYKVDPQWWDKNLDRRWIVGGAPNDLVIAGIIGMPFPDAEATGAITVLDAWLYWRAKSGASGTVYTPTGDPIALTDTPAIYQDFVRNWTIRTAVASVG